MGVSDGLTIHVRREEGGKIRVTSALWEDAKVIGKHKVLEVRNVDGRLHIARKERHHDEWDPKIEPHDPYGHRAIQHTARYTELSQERFKDFWRT